MQNNPKISNRKIIANSRLFQIEQLDLRFANGEQRTYERLLSRSRGAVLVIPMLNPETFILIREYAAGVERYELGFPKGLIDAGEDILSAANRELMEEIKYAAKKLRLLKHTSTSPGYWNSYAAVLLAQELYPAERVGDEPEPLEIVPWKLADIDKLLQRDDFSEARSIAALYLMQEALRHG